MTKEGAGRYTAYVTVGALLARHGLSAYRVAAEGRGKVSRNAVYALARGATARVDLGTLERLADLLEQLTGERVNVEDLLKLERTT